MPTIALNVAATIDAAIRTAAHRMTHTKIMNMMGISDCNLLATQVFWCYAANFQPKGGTCQMAIVVKRKTGTKTQATRASKLSKTETVRCEWSPQDEKLVRSLAKTAEPVRDIARKLGRTEGALRQKAFAMHVSFKTKARMAAQKGHRTREARAA